MSDINDLLIREYDEDHDGPTRTYSACPLCDGALVRRVNSRTKEAFMGCGKFPQCSGSVSLVEYEPVTKGTR